MSRIVRRIARRIDAKRAQRRFFASLTHLHGPRSANTPKDAVILVALVRDGLFYIDEFLRHYRDLGAAQFVFCDNGSTDGTVERLATESDCVVLRSDLPWGEVENLFRRHAAERYAPERWCIFADMDEIFAFEGDTAHGLPGLTAGLDAGAYTALVAQMLEMAPRASLSEASRWSYAQALERFKWYDLSNVERMDYHDPQIGFAWYLRQNSLSNSQVQIMFGGLRKRVFGEHCCLTKHPLVKLTGGALPGVHPHTSAHVHCAPFTGLIKHYKFAGNTAARDADTLARGVISHGENKTRLNRLNAEPSLTLLSEGMQVFKGLEALYESNFLLRRPE